MTVATATKKPAVKKSATKPELESREGVEAAVATARKALNPKSKATALAVGQVYRLRNNATRKIHNVKVSDANGPLAVPIRVKNGEPCGPERKYDLGEWEVEV